MVPSQTRLRHRGAGGRRGKEAFLRNEVCSASLSSTVRRAGVGAAEGAAWICHVLLLLSLIGLLGKGNTLNHKVAHARRIQKSVWWLHEAS